MQCSAMCSAEGVGNVGECHGIYRHTAESGGEKMPVVARGPTPVLGPIIGSDIAFGAAYC